MQDEPSGRLLSVSSPIQIIIVQKKIWRDLGGRYQKMTYVPLVIADCREPFLNKLDLGSDLGLDKLTKLDLYQSSQESKKNYNISYNSNLYPFENIRQTYPIEQPNIVFRYFKQKNLKL